MFNLNRCAEGYELDESESEDINRIGGKIGYCTKQDWLKISFSNFMCGW